ncbi:uncharacterized protein K489DRAFT_21947 [Dissoconium aciculare CBS 342.82]|uniref:Uncharacterized protein n=1 Tax=Dissoconium aciculare CBS 342.82 TaxID=1314786 RepID=A0A6J3MI63_9PEZI|nr:uncharacterized protein K489DRAFT_21947 [Dissoconium aciculare CBS 342.82]KAF1827605.1 hypothetical protein K489DRAFT_21947 [Dissoconium aciculare CBS 342.82]
MRSWLSQIPPLFLVARQPTSQPVEQSASWAPGSIFLAPTLEFDSTGLLPPGNAVNIYELLVGCRSSSPCVIALSLAGLVEHISRILTIQSWSPTATRW